MAGNGAGRGSWQARADDEDRGEPDRRGADRRGADRGGAGRGAGGPHRGARGNSNRGATGAASRGHVHFDDQYVEMRACNECGEVGYLRRNCPSLPDDGPRLGYTIFASRAALRDPAIRRNTVILDNGASTSRFANRRLTRYIRSDDSVQNITAFGGQVIACGESGMLPGFFRIGLNVECNGNVLALTDIERVATVKYLQNDRFIVTTHSPRSALRLC